MMTLETLAGTTWRGTSELWLDPLGNTAETGPCTLTVTPEGVRYEWAYQGAPQHGTVTTGPDGATFTDTWHSPQPMACAPAGTGRALVDVVGSYGAGDGPSWGWRLTLSCRPSYEGAPEALVLQMTNITPWGEEGRAVRMTATRS